MTGTEDFPHVGLVFFACYQRLRQRVRGLNEDLEPPAITRLLPGVAGAACPAQDRTVTSTLCAPEPRTHEQNQPG
jgi:hypothetical protein